jgi:hypothetical protein
LGRSAGEDGGTRPRRTRTTSSDIRVPYTNTLWAAAAAAADAGGGGDAMGERGSGE